MSRLFRSVGLRGEVLETFHSLRSTRIAADFDQKLDPRVKRIQVGHEVADIHEGYAPGFSAAEANELRSLPIDNDIDLSGFFGLDFDALKAQRRKGRRRKTTIGA